MPAPLTRSPSAACLGLLFLFVAISAHAAEAPAEKSESETVSSDKAATTGTSTTAAKPATTSSTTSSTSTSKHVALLKDAKKIEGLLPLYWKEEKLYAELSSSSLSREYVVLLAIARGIGKRPLYGGMTWSLGDDWVWKFRKVNKRIHVIRRNVRFKATKGKPIASAVETAYTDSVLFSLPILTTGPKGGDLVDLSAVFMTDLPKISMVLPGFVFSSTKSSYASVKGFPDNVEVEVAATYASSGKTSIDSVPDSRGVTINVHYSISRLPSTGYQPRLADPRVGHFLTVLKDYSKQTDGDQYVRYINRWDLQKADAAAKISPPKRPVIFWIENTVPYKYRKPIREGILEWNRAFEKAGFVDAIEVRQQPEKADWDPEDINYNTFRWITSSASFAMGPSRVNPYTGQILDADIIFDADFLQYWKNEIDTNMSESIAGGPLDLNSDRLHEGPRGFCEDCQHYHGCNLSAGMARQLSFAHAALVARAEPKQLIEAKEKLIMQGIKEVTMHEVGHTLGLRHNFKASTYLTLDEMNDPNKTRDTGLTASVMDYAPPNIVPKGVKQGDFYSTTIGPYDMWAIEYGYKPFSGGTTGEVAELKKIAARSGEPALAYSTDEDCRSTDPDPLVNRFDMGKDLVAFGERKTKLVAELVPGIVDRMTEDGDDYTQARRAFNVLLSKQSEAMFFAARYVGGLHTSRSHKGDKDAKPPIAVVEPKKQREALALLEKEVFGAAAYQFSPTLLNHLGPTRWKHWGQEPTERPDYPIHEMVAKWQKKVLDHLLSSLTLQRLIDNEIKVPADRDAFTAAELMERLTKSVFAELDAIQQGEFTNRKPAINSPRRRLQRDYFQRLAKLVIGTTKAPEDCRAVAMAELTSLNDRIAAFLERKIKLDTYSRAHLSELQGRINKVVEADLDMKLP